MSADLKGVYAHSKKIKVETSTGSTSGKVRARERSSRASSFVWNLRRETSAHLAAGPAADGWLHAKTMPPAGTIRSAPPRPCGALPGGMWRGGRSAMGAGPTRGEYLFLPPQKPSSVEAPADCPPPPRTWQSLEAGRMRCAVMRSRAETPEREAGIRAAERFSACPPRRWSPPTLVFPSLLTSPARPPARGPRAGRRVRHRQRSPPRPQRDHLHLHPRLGQGRQGERPGPRSVSPSA